eukprot:4462289-Prymnesium_polylepis.1
MLDFVALAAQTVVDGSGHVDCDAAQAALRSMSGPSSRKLSENPLYAQVVKPTNHGDKGKQRAYEVHAVRRMRPRNEDRVLE